MIGKWWVWATLLLLLALAGCQPQVEVVRVQSSGTAEVREVIVTRQVLVTPEGVGLATPGTPSATATAVLQEVAVTPPPVGGAERPIRLLFPPSFPEQVLQQRTGALQTFLSSEMMLSSVVEQPESHEAVIEALCAAPAETIAFIPAAMYAIAQVRCNAQPGATAVMLDVDRQMGMIVARRDSGVTRLEDLDGLTWAVPEPPALIRTALAEAMLAEAGVEPGEIRTYESENSALLAVFNGEADFATATFVPPVLPFNERAWIYGEDVPEIWRGLGFEPERHPVGYVIVVADPEDGGYRIRDARAGLFDVEPGILSETRILAVTEPIPNDTVVFGADFPIALAREITTQLVGFAASEACSASLCSSDFYRWNGLAVVDDSAYAPLYAAVETLGLSDEALWEMVSR